MDINSNLPETLSTLVNKHEYVFILFSNQSNINKNSMIPFRACQLSKVEKNGSTQ